MLSQQVGRAEKRASRLDAGFSGVLESERRARLGRARASSIQGVSGGGVV